MTKEQYIKQVLTEMSKRFNPDKAFLSIGEVNRGNNKYDFEMSLLEPELKGAPFVYVTSKEPMTFTEFKDRLKEKGFEIKGKRKPIYSWPECRRYSMCNQNAYYVGFEDTSHWFALLNSIGHPDCTNRFYIRKKSNSTEFVLFVGLVARARDTNLVNLLKKTGCKLSVEQLTKFDYEGDTYYVNEEKVKEFFTENDVIAVGLEKLGVGLLEFEV